MSSENNATETHARSFGASSARFSLATLALLALAIGCAKKVERSAAERGAILYVRHCASCHGPNGEGNQVMGFDVQPRNLADPAFHRERSDQQIIDVLRHGKGQMPPLGQLMNDQQLSDLVQHIRTLPLRTR